MKIRFLGTGAADWGLNDTDCNGANRFFSSALIDGELLIDPGPHVFLSAEKYGIDLSGIRYIINTHPHKDHFNEETVEKLCGAGAVFTEFTAENIKELGGYKISAFAANHGTCVGAVHFIIEKQDKKLFYGLDSAWLLYDEVAAIKKIGVDMAVLDATIGDVDGDYRIFEHNNLAMVEEIKKTLSPFVKCFVISHMARTLHTDHEALSRRAQSAGLIAAYDNFEIEI
ncbi:MAG: MBL fold metallo-hydrolase [Clostridia bacterium]|nr:MBL fold metallo-hydrolase [Clostridia bacterium]